MSEMNKKDLLFGTAIDGVTEADYARMMPGVLAMAKGMEMCLHQGICIFDCYKQEIMYISCHWANFFNVRKEYFDISENVFNSIECTDIIFHATAMKDIVNFYARLPENERLDYISSFPLKTMIGEETIQLFHRLSPIALSRTGKIWLVLCTSFPATKNVKRIVYMQNKDTGARLRLNMRTHCWENELEPLYGSKEKKILTLAAQGLSIDEIANVMQMTTDSVKACRRRVFEQMRVRSIQEAITYTMNHNFIK